MRTKTLKMPSSSASKITLSNFSAGVDADSDESVTALSRASIGYNYCFSDGTLKAGYGLSVYSPLSRYNVMSIWLYKRYDPEEETDDNRLMFLASDNFVYYLTGSGAKRLDGISFRSPPQTINYRLYGDDVIIMCGEKEGMYVYNGVDSPYKVDNAPFITSLTLHYERLFVTTGGEKNTVWFSDDLDPTNFDVSLSGGGFIQLLDERGISGSVLSFNNYIYVFREYGISRIIAYADQSEFSMTNLFVSGSRICFGSIVLCGDRVIFLTEDGLYSFDGVSTTKIFKTISSVFMPSEYADAVYSNGKYYLAFKGNFKDGGVVGDENKDYKNNGLLVYSISDKRCELSRGMDIVKLCAADESVIGINSKGKAGVIEKCGTYLGEAMYKKWRFPKTDFSEIKNKRITDIYLYSKYDCIINLISDEKEKLINVKGKPSPQRIKTNFTGGRIGMEIISETAKADISRPTLLVSKF